MATIPQFQSTIFRFLVAALCFFGSCEALLNEYGILAAESSSDKENFCIKYFPEFRTLPEKKSESDFYIYQDTSEIDWCEEQVQEYKSQILVLSKSNCSLEIQARNVQDQGGVGAFFLVPPGRAPQVNVNATAALTINITVGLISETSLKRLQQMNSTISVCLYAPYVLSFNFSLLIIWIVAMFTITVGSYWSGRVRFAIYFKEMSMLPGGDRDPAAKPTVKPNPIEDSSLNISPYYVAMFVMCMGAMLLLLYFFFSYLVYFIIGLFVLATVISIYGCLYPFVMRIPNRPLRTRCGKMACTIDFRQVFLILFALAIPIYWFIIRKDKYAWILQDVLGVTFCIHMLKSIRLPNLKICTVLLVLLFFYDIFFVFVTPFLTVKGESVMEEVATGGKSEEMLPMVLKVAHLGYDPLSICYQQFSLLGFGDILVPGLLVSYCHGFDLINNKRKIYFPVTVATYGIGLLITFLGLFLMSTAQPALLYLVPTTLLPPIILGYCNGELSLLWNGFKVVKHSHTARVDVQNVITPGGDSVGPPNIISDPLPGVSTYIAQEGGVSPTEVPTDATGERKHLLKS